MTTSDISHVFSTLHLMKHFSHLNSAVSIIESYNGAQPFHQFIKNHFSQHKKYGSKDRKQITHLCYCYFRLGLTAGKRPLPEAMVEALFLCSDQPNELLQALQPAWNEKVEVPLAEKCALINLPFDTLNIFPFPDAVSEGIETTAFNFSHLHQPDVFIRVRPGWLPAVTGKLEGAAVPYTITHGHCIRLAQATKIDALLQLNKEVVIQDYSSQRTGDFMQWLAAEKRPIETWDCCAASGGKSILAKDMLNTIDLTVSDIRPAVLANLKKRFSEAGISNYQLLPADLSKPGSGIAKQRYQFIIADVPCTGSGTWGRNPERLCYFKRKEIETYSQLQQKIVTAAMNSLQPGGYFLYITCSVFKKENEDMVTFLQQTQGLKLLQMDLLRGYQQKADTMFAAMMKSI